MDFIKCLELSIGKTVRKVFKPMQKGDVIETHADISNLDYWVGFKPKTKIDVGINNLVKWYKIYYGI